MKILRYTLICSLIVSNLLLKASSSDEPHVEWLYRNFQDKLSFIESGAQVTMDRALGKKKIDHNADLETIKNVSFFNAFAYRLSRLSDSKIKDCSLESKKDTIINVFNAVNNNSEMKSSIKKHHNENVEKLNKQRHSLVFFMNVMELKNEANVRYSAFEAQVDEVSKKDAVIDSNENSCILS